MVSFASFIGVFCVFFGVFLDNRRSLLGVFLDNRRSLFGVFFWDKDGVFLASWLKRPNTPFRMEGNYCFETVKAIKLYQVLTCWLAAGKHIIICSV